MKIVVELDETEELMLKEAFESAIAECYFAGIEEDEKNDYFSALQKLINKFTLKLSVDSVIDELVELNNEIDNDFDDEIDIVEEEEDE